MGMRKLVSEALFIHLHPSGDRRIEYHPCRLAGPISVDVDLKRPAFDLACSIFSQYFCDSPLCSDPGQNCF